MRRRLRSFALALLGMAALTLPARAQFIKGVDLSLLDFIQDHGVAYKEAGQVKDPLLILKDHGCNYVRLRLFLSPNGREGQVNSLSYTLRLARRAKLAGFKLLLDLHYSDGWADPAHQRMPAEWAGLSHAQLVDRMYAYTRETLASFRREGCLPDMVEVGNEITNGLLWPDGGPLSDATQWDNLADLLKAGIRGARDNDPGGIVRIMIHIDKGGNTGVSHWFFDHLQQRSVNFDVIGLSYYPFWNGTLADLRTNLEFLAATYKKDVVVAETSFNSAGGGQQKLEFPVTPAGQKQFLEGLMRVIAATPGGRGKGLFYWAPEWIAGHQWNAPAGSGDWENRALFDHTGNMLPALRAFELEANLGAGTSAR